VALASARNAAERRFLARRLAACGSAERVANDHTPTPSEASNS